MHRLDLGLYSDPKEFLGNGVKTHANCKEKSFLLEAERTRDAASRGTASPTHYQLSYTDPQVHAVIVRVNLCFPLDCFDTLGVKGRCIVGEGVGDSCRGVRHRYLFVFTHSGGDTNTFDV